MSDVEGLLRGGVEHPTVGSTDLVPPRLSTRDDGHGQVTPHPRLNATNDRAWAVAFKLNVAITVISALYFHQAALTAAENMVISREWRLSEDRSGAGAIVLACMQAVPSAYALSWALLLVMSRCSVLIVKLPWAIFGLVLGGIVLVASGAVLGGAILALLCAMIADVVLRRGRIEFAAANLKVAVRAVKATPQIMYWAPCMMMFRVIWLFVAGIASFGSSTAFQTVLSPDGKTYDAADCLTVPRSSSTPASCECDGNVFYNKSGCAYSNPNAFLACFWVASVAWSGGVAMNVVSATVAGSVSAWWSSPGDVGTVWVSCRRVLHSSLGSMSKPSVVTGLVVSLQYLVDHVLVALSAICCPLHCVRWAVTYMVETTIVVFIGMYRLNVSEAAHRAWKLFGKYGMALFINEVVVTMGLGLVSLAGLATVILSIVMSPASLSSTPEIVVIIAYGAGALAISATIEVVAVAFKAVNISFLQDPEAFSASHDRRLYDGMYRAWREMKLPHPPMTEEQEEIQV